MSRWQHHSQSTVGALQPEQPVAWPTDAQTRTASWFGARRAIAEATSAQRISEDRMKAFISSVVDDGYLNYGLSSLSLELGEIEEWPLMLV